MISSNSYFTHIKKFCETMTLAIWWYGLYHAYVSIWLVMTLIWSNLCDILFLLIATDRHNVLSEWPIVPIKRGQWRWLRSNSEFSSFPLHTSLPLSGLRKTYSTMPVANYINILLYSASKILWKWWRYRALSMSSRMSWIESSPTSIIESFQISKLKK